MEKPLNIQPLKKTVVGRTRPFIIVGCGCLFIVFLLLLSLLILIPKALSVSNTNSSSNYTQETGLINNVCSILNSQLIPPDSFFSSNALNDVSGNISVSQMEDILNGCTKVSQITSSANVKNMMDQPYSVIAKLNYADSTTKDVDISFVNENGSLKIDKINVYTGV